MHNALYWYYNLRSLQNYIKLIEELVFVYVSIMKCVKYMCVGLNWAAKITIVIYYPESKELKKVYVRVSMRIHHWWVQRLNRSVLSFHC